MKMQKATCCFTGHRPQNLPFGFNEDDPRCLELKKKLQNIIEKLYEAGVRHFITGMAIGVDMYAAEIVIELRKTHPDITLESAIPCETQATRWSVAMQERYYEIASKCGCNINIPPTVCKSAMSIWSIIRTMS